MIFAPRNDHTVGGDGEDRCATQKVALPAALLRMTEGASWSAVDRRPRNPSLEAKRASSFGQALNRAAERPAILFTSSTLGFNDVRGAAIAGLDTTRPNLVDAMRGRHGPKQAHLIQPTTTREARLHDSAQFEFGWMPHGRLPIELKGEEPFREI